MKNSTGSNVAFSLAFLLLFLSLCTALARIDAGSGVSQAHSTGVLPGLYRLAALMPHPY